MLLLQQSFQPAAGGDGLHAVRTADGSAAALHRSACLLRVLLPTNRYITEETPFMLMRDFMITSTVNPATVIDYQYLAHRVALGDGQTPVTFTFQNVTLVNVR